MPCLKSLLVGFFVGLTTLVPAKAATLDIVVSQVGSDVVFKGRGSIDLADMVFDRSEPSASTSANLPTTLFGFGSSYDVYSGFQNPRLLSSTQLFSFSGQGSSFGLSVSGFFVVDVGYNSLDPISFTWTTTNRTIDALELNFGLLASSARNAVTLSTATAPVPLPAGVFLLFSGLAGLVLTRHCKRMS